MTRKGFYHRGIEKGRACHDVDAVSGESFLTKRKPILLIERGETIECHPSGKAKRTPAPLPEGSSACN